MIMEGAGDMEEAQDDDLHKPHSNSDTEFLLTDHAVNCMTADRLWLLTGHTADSTIADGKHKTTLFNIRQPIKVTRLSETDDDDDDYDDEEDEACSQSVDEPKSAANIGVQKSTANIDETKSTANIDETKSAANIDVPKSAANIDVPKSAANIDVPKSAANIDVPKSAANIDIPKSAANISKKLSCKTDHVTFEELPATKGFEFVPQKATRFGLDTSSSDHNFQILAADDDDDDDDDESDDRSHTSETDSPVIQCHVDGSTHPPVVMCHVGGSKVPEAATKCEPVKQESTVLHYPGKCDQHNHSSVKAKLSSQFGKKNNFADKTETSLLLVKHPRRATQSISIDELSHQDDVGENHKAHVRQEMSEEEDFPFTNTSEDADHVMSPSIVSNDVTGVCSKCSQLSQDGSSSRPAKSATVAGEYEENNQTADQSRPAKSATVAGEYEDNNQTADQSRDRIIFEHSLELGVAFTEFVDVDAFRISLGKSSPHTEDRFGGRSEEHLLIMLRGGSRKSLKSYLRNSQCPAESNARRRFWEHLCNHLLNAEEHLYQELVDDMFPRGMEEDLPLPAFVELEHLHCYLLTSHGIQHVNTVVNVLSSLHPDITYCPMLYPLTCLFLHYMPPEACFNCVQALLANTKPYYFTQTRIKTQASKFVLRDLAKKYAKQAYALLVRSAKSVEAVFDNWMWWIFRDLPFQYLVRIIDSYLLEGYKVLYRVSLAIVILFAKESSKHGRHNSPVHNIDAAISRFCKTMNVDPKRLIKVGFSIRGLSRKEIEKLHEKNESHLRSLPAKASVPRIVSSQSVGNISIARSFNGPRLRHHVLSAVLTPEMLHNIWQWIPVRLSLMKPKILFSSDEHGTAIRTLYTRTEHAAHTILAIKTTTDEIFGAFCSSPWITRHEKNKPHTSFFGTGETFVFSLWPETRCFPWTGLLGYPPEHTADLFMAGDDHMLVIGSGNGEAIYLDTMMNRCSSTHCTTFDNDPLCSSSDFSCRVVEVFGFVD